MSESKPQRQFWQQEARQTNPARIVFFDESGITTRMTRHYGRAWGRGFPLRLKSGELVVMNNLGAHRVDGPRELVETAGATLCYVPPYPHDFNPIENADSGNNDCERSKRALSQALSRPSSQPSILSLHKMAPTASVAEVIP